MISRDTTMYIRILFSRVACRMILHRKIQYCSTVYCNNQGRDIISQNTMQLDTTLQDTMQLDITYRDTTNRDTTQQDTTLLDTTQQDTTLQDTTLQDTTYQLLGSSEKDHLLSSRQMSLYQETFTAFKRSRTHMSTSYPTQREQYWHIRLNSTSYTHTSAMQGPMQYLLHLFSNSLFQLVMMYAS